MNAFETIGCDTVACNYPREAYRPDDLTGEQQMALWHMLRNAAASDGLKPEEAEEGASKMFFHWRTRNYAKCGIARGDHAYAYWGVRRYAKLSRWMGFTGLRRNRKGALTAENLAMSESSFGRLMLQRIMGRTPYTPASVAVAVERIANSPKYGRKAYRLAKKMGLPGVRELVREACGFGEE